MLRNSVAALLSGCVIVEPFNNKISKLHERCLRIVYNDKISSFKELLTDKFVLIHIKNLHVLATKMFKVYRNISPPILRQSFWLRNNDYNLQQFSQFDLPSVRNVFFGTESILLFGPKIWNIIPTEFMKETSLYAFKKLIKNCPCRPYKSYIQNIGFIYDFFLHVYGFRYCSLFKHLIWLT